MADRKTLSTDDWEQVATWIKEEKERRANSKARLAIEAIWKEVDRQVAMDPVPRTLGRGNKSDWYPEIELPSQFNTLEVLAADARRLLFPRDTDWFYATSNLSDDYMERFLKRRQSGSLLGPKWQEFIKAKASASGQPTPESPTMNLDQETADVLVKVTLDHFHRYYDFSGNMDLWLAEIFKYGTSPGRVRQVKWTKFNHEFRGVTADSIVGPGFWCPGIKNTYPDDSSAQVMHEGVMTGPLTLYRYYQQLEDLKRAAKEGGKDRGWMPSKISDLQPLMGDDEKKGQVELIFAEGDVIVPKSRDSIFLPNVWITIAVGNNGAVPVRFETNPQPFRSFVFGHYMRIDVDSPYAVSPLMKGQPVAEGMTEIWADILATSRLRARPPTVYDKNDPVMAASGGPDISPSAMIGTDNPQGITPLEIGDLSAAVQAFTAAKMMYEELTGVTAQRRSAEAKSHTTKAAADYQANIGLSRTEDFVSSLETGPLTSILYMEYEIGRQSLGKKGQSISVDQDGIQGWVKLATDDLPDEALFVVTGSSGMMDIQTRNQQALQAHVAAVQGAAAAAQMGSPVALNFVEMIKDGYHRAGIQNAEKFVAQAPAPDPNQQKPDPEMMKVQADAQLAQQESAAKLQMQQQDMQMKAQQSQQKLEQESQLAAAKAQSDAEIALEVERIKSATSIEVARINAGSEVERNVQQIVADVLNAAHDREAAVQEGASQIAPDLKQHSQAMTDAVQQMSEHIKGMADMHRQSMDAHAKALETMNKPRRRSVSMKKVNGIMQADIMEQ
jgi:hypothetical protein